MTDIFIICSVFLFANMCNEWGRLEAISFPWSIHVSLQLGLAVSRGMTFIIGPPQIIKLVFTLKYRPTYHLILCFHTFLLLMSFGVLWKISSGCHNLSPLQRLTQHCSTAGISVYVYHGSVWLPQACYLGHPGGLSLILVSGGPGLHKFWVDPMASWWSPVAPFTNMD